MLELRLRIPGGPIKRFSLDRGGPGFSARDRAVLDLLHPHLVQLHRAWQSRGRLREALAVHESTRAAVVLLEADDRVAFASTAARELLGRYFGENGVRLPASVASWLPERRRTATCEPLRVEAGERALVIEPVDGALLLEEQRRLPRLTAREREILDLVAEGKTNRRSLSACGSRPGPCASTSTTSTPHWASTPAPPPPHSSGETTAPLARAVTAYYTILD